MKTWDEKILSEEVNEEFLNEIDSLDRNDVADALLDACRIAAPEASPTEEEACNGLAAATIVAIWAGAPFSAGEAADRFPVIRARIGQVDEALTQAAARVLEGVDTDDDIEDFLEVLS